MNSIAREQIQLLVEIQTIGTQKDIVGAKLNDAPSKLAALDGELETSAAVVEELEARLGELAKQYRELEGEAQSEQSREKRNQERLRDIKNNKDYQAMLKEIANIKKKVSGLEDQMLAMLDEQESLKAQVAEKKKEHGNVAQRVQRQRAAIEQETEALEQKARQLKEKMDSIGQKVDAALLDKYDWVKGRVGRNAIVAVKDAVCQGCHLNIPPQMFNELQRCDSVEFCPHCRRMIYWNNGSEWSGRSPDRPQAGPEESPNTAGQGAP